MDLGTEEGVRTYLAGTAWGGAEIIPLSGGYTNFVFRLRLTVPYRGKDTVVLKHAKGHVKISKSMKIGLERQVRCVQPVCAGAPLEEAYLVNLDRGFAVCFCCLLCSSGVLTSFRFAEIRSRSAEACA